MNTGNRNTGSLNTGDWNTGNWNTGNWNTGNRNTGSLNTGDCNTGDRNTGSWNTGNWNTGFCNTTTPKVTMFNKLTDKNFNEITFPRFFYFDLTVWVTESNMSDKEKTAFPSYITTGGFLKINTYRGAWRESWDKTSIEDRKLCLSLPNWDNDIFKEISGIDVEKELIVEVEEMTLSQVCEKLGKNIKIIKD
jgi:hypothetical protein